jgi:S-adenosylmethionine hydrolase
MSSLTQPPLITLTTDFGGDSPYVAQTKGQILRTCRHAHLVDLCHRISPQDIAQAAWFIRHCSIAFPRDTCHLVVVDPGVGTDRQIVLARINLQYFVAPDNGLLWPLAEQHQPDWVRSVTQRQYWTDPPSPTFHGRDIMAPVAAYLCNGVPPENFGPKVSTLFRLPDISPRKTQQGLEGRIVFIDAFGNLITNVEALKCGKLPPEKTIVHLPRQGVTCRGLVTTYAQRPPGELIALFGSSHQLEVAVVNGSAAERLGARIGDVVVVGN